MGFSRIVIWDFHLLWYGTSTYCGIGISLYCGMDFLMLWRSRGNVNLQVASNSLPDPAILVCGCCQQGQKCLMTY